MQIKSADIKKRIEGVSSIAEVAEELGINPCTIYRQLAKEYLPKLYAHAINNVMDEIEHKLIGW